MDHGMDDLVFYVFEGAVQRNGLTVTQKARRASGGTTGLGFPPQKTVVRLTPPGGAAEAVVKM